MKRIIVVMTIAFSYFVFAPSKSYDMEIQQVNWKGRKVLQATGEVVDGDAQRFADALSKAKPLPHGLIVVLLNSPGGSVSESLRISTLFSLFKIHAVVPKDGRCASACASIIFVAAEYRTIEEGGLLGQHSCADAVSGIKNEKCNEMISKHAVEHGVSYGSISAFITYTAPEKMIWFTRPDVDCYGITRYPFSTESGFEKSEPCVIEAITGKTPGAQSVWRIDFKLDGGYRAFLRPVADNKRELELNVFCKNDVPEILFLSMDIKGPSTLVKQAIKSAYLEADPVTYGHAKFSISQADAGFSRVVIQIRREDVIKFLTETNRIKFGLEVNAPYKPIFATTYLSESRKALLFAANDCINQAKNELAR